MGGSNTLKRAAATHSSPSPTRRRHQVPRLDIQGRRWPRRGRGRGRQDGSNDHDLFDVLPADTARGKTISSSLARSVPTSFTHVLHLRPLRVHGSRRLTTSSFTGKPTTPLRDAPIVIVVPVTLHPQWFQDFRRWCQPGMVNILQYTATFNLDVRKSFWESAYNQVANQPNSRIIILATVPVRVPLTASIQSCLTRPGTPSQGFSRRLWRRILSRGAYRASSVDSVQ